MKRSPSTFRHDRASHAGRRVLGVCCRHRLCSRCRYSLVTSSRSSSGIRPYCQCLGTVQGVAVRCRDLAGCKAGDKGIDMYVARSCALTNGGLDGMLHTENCTERVSVDLNCWAHARQSGVSRATACTIGISGMRLTYAEIAPQSSEFRQTR